MSICPHTILPFSAKEKSLNFSPNVFWLFKRKFPTLTVHYVTCYFIQGFPLHLFSRKTFLLSPKPQFCQPCLHPVFKGRIVKEWDSLQLVICTAVLQAVQLYSTVCVYFGGQWEGSWDCVLTACECVCDCVWVWLWVCECVCDCVCVIVCECVSTTKANEFYRIMHKRNNTKTQ